MVQTYCRYGSLPPINHDVLTQIKQEELLPNKFRDANMRGIFTPPSYEAVNSAEIFTLTIG